MPMIWRRNTAPAEPSDYGWIKGRLREFDREIITALPQEAYTIIAELDGRPTGGMIFLNRLGWTQVDSLWVEPHCRGKGIGSSLLMEAEDHAQRENHVGVRISTTTGHQGLELYLRRGYLIDVRYPISGTTRPKIEEVLLSRRFS